MLPDLKIRRQFPNGPDPDRRLRIGYLCNYTHVEHFESLFADVLLTLDPAQFEVFFFADGRAPASLRGSHLHWCDCTGMSNRDIAPVIAGYEIDVIQDLNGYGGAWIFALAERLAPVQVGGANWCTTTGLEAFDYVLGYTDSPGEDEARHYAERVYRFPHSRGVIRLPDYLPAVVPPPCLDAGFVTFGCFGQSHKVNPETIALWARILRAVPTARLFLQSNAFNAEAGVALYTELFREQGIEAHRLVLKPSADYRIFLESYAKVDIALDTYPHSGGNTTYEAIGSGVPLVTLNGPRFNSQFAAHLLTMMGVGELAANSEAEYVEIAVKLAGDTVRMTQYRNSLPDLLRRSPYGDVDRFGRDLAVMYRDVWRTWCAEQAASRR
jgi:predicted O-linked N-acetylglucosamine transferase (SPINDLY family)